MTTLRDKHATTWLGGKVTARRMKPTRQHRAGVWEMMLGTVHAMNDQGLIKYFDYDWDGALEYAGYSPDRDPRLAKYDGQRRLADLISLYDVPRKGQTVLWILKEQAK